MPVITLPDGSRKEFDQPVTVAAVAASIGEGLARAALAGKVDGQEVDLSYVIDQDSALSIVTARDELRAMLKDDGPAPSAPFEGLEVLRPAVSYKNRHASILLTLDAASEAVTQLAETQTA